jgi:hypothetical protein
LAYRVIRVLWMLLLFEVGVLLVCLPWVGLWDTNYFLVHYPVLRPYLLHPSVRGAITGLGALDIYVAAGMLRRHPAASETHSAPEA